MLPIVSSADGNRIKLDGAGDGGPIARHSINTVIAALEAEVAIKFK